MRIEHEFANQGRVKGVPHRAFNVVMLRHKPTRLQHAQIVVASFDDEERANDECQSRNDHNFDDNIEFWVEAAL